jgi:hypothetical protein
MQSWSQIAHRIIHYIENLNIGEYEQNLKLFNNIALFGGRN